MKDKEARASVDRTRKAIDLLADRIGLSIYFTLEDTHENHRKDGLFCRLATQERKLAALEAKFAAQEESAKPVCKSCGQKIQEGLQVGNVEALAAGLKKGKK